MNEQTAVFGLSAIAIVYWLVAHGKRNDIITNGKGAFLTTGGAWSILVVLNHFAPTAGMLLLTILGGWAATTLFKAGAKDNESK
jgi:hypothetical protein